jgi:hypothetical protein
MLTLHVAVEPLRVAATDNESLSDPVESTTSAEALHAIVVLVEIAESIVIVKSTTMVPV